MRLRPSFIVVAAALLAITTVAVTWPLFADPATTVLDTPRLYGDASVFVQRDINLTMWILAWDTHALTTDPLRLFHANAFYPAPYGLALSEHMLGNVPLFAPIYLATGNPVLAHQATLAATFVLAGLAMAAYVHHWTRDPGAALAAGFFFAFAPYRLWQLGNLHVISIHWLPLVPLGIDLALAGRRRAGGALLAAALVAATCCSYYVGYAAFALAGAYAAVSLVGRRDPAHAAGALAAPIGVAAGVVVLVTLPYLILQRDGIIQPGHVQAGVDDIAFVAASQGPARFLRFLVTPRRDEIPQFLGYAVAALAVAALAFHRRPPRGALLAVGATGFVLALGPSLTLPGGRQIALPYAYLQDLVPGFAAMRVPQRFGALLTLTATALAGLGLAALRARVAARGYRRHADWLAAALVVVALGEAHTPGLRSVDVPVGPSIPPVYRWLAAHGEGGALIELPMKATHLLRHSQAMYYSTVHWLPLANGYTPYPPATHTAFMDAAAHLPDAAALDRLLAVAPLRWILVNRRYIDEARWPSWASAFAAAGLRVAAEFPQATVFEVPPARRTS